MNNAVKIVGMICASACFITALVLEPSFTIGATALMLPTSLLLYYFIRYI